MCTKKTTINKTPFATEQDSIIAHVHFSRKNDENSRQRRPDETPETKTRNTSASEIYTRTSSVSLSQYISSKDTISMMALSITVYWLGPADLLLRLREALS
ncbi:hypothetical protein Trydic_g23343 [Trypoxylus dichotomus]